LSLTKGTEGEDILMVVEVGTGADTDTGTAMAAAADGGVVVGGEDNMRDPHIMAMTV
jgi:hypothetical protein